MRQLLPIGVCVQLCVAYHRFSQHAISLSVWFQHFSHTPVVMQACAAGGRRRYRSNNLYPATLAVTLLPAVHVTCATGDTVLVVVEAKPDATDSF